MTEQIKTILIAEDDKDDQLVLKKAFEEIRVSANLIFVNDGQELLNYLYHEEGYTNKKNYPDPNLILVDLNMPRIDGREAIRTIKGDKNLRKIPLVVLSTSKDEDDILQSYDLGVNSFISKPLTFESMVKKVRILENYWFKVAKIPSQNNGK